MADNTWVNGVTIIWMAMVSTLGEMAVCTRVNTVTIKSMDLEYTNGQTVESMQATGTEVNNTDSAHTTSQERTKRSMVSGKMVVGSTGLHLKRSKA